MNSQGADTSKWDGGPSDNLQLIDFDKYKTAYPFVVIKVSEGTVKDPLFDRQWAAAKGRVIRSAYHFWRSFVDQKLSVQKMLGFLGSDAGEMPASLDVEVADGSTSVMSLVQVWVNEYNRLTGKWPIIYSTPSFLHENGADAKSIWGVYKNAWLAKCGLWLATWPFDELNSMAGYVQTGDALRALLIQEVIDGKRLLTWPKPIAPWTKVDMWQWTSRFPPEQIPGYYMGLYHKKAVDMNFHTLPRIDLESQYPLSGVAPTEPPVVEPPAPVVFHIQRLRSEVELLVTPNATDVYPLKGILQQATENGWEAAINCGAGFDYVDATSARIKTAGFQSIQVANGTVFYARRAIIAGAIYSELDATYKAPWTMLGFDAANVHLIVTKGQEGEEGMTQVQAAQWAKARGITDCYLMDSGHSSGIAENGALLYSAYGEPVPQCLGIRPRIAGGTMIKATCKAGAVANIKNMANGTLLHQMTGGESVYGAWSSQKTDIVSFSHYYAADGTKVELGASCKVSVGTNLTITENATEPGDVTPPPPPPPAGPVKVHSIWVYSDGSMVIDGVPYH
jgi:hypothetical protein